MDKEKILEKMTDREKIAYCTGKDFWHTKKIKRLGVESIMVSDGPFGLRCQKGESENVGVKDSISATCFPPSVTSASTWNRELLRAEGEAIGEEALEEDVSIVLGPGCNIKRNPLSGRNFEYYSEDPMLSGEMAGEWIRGMESTGTGACLKHFAANSQETKRMVSDSLLDERTLREIYLSSFERAIKKSNPTSLMCSYNKINGTYASDNSFLLDEILRKEWHWDGLVISDWGAMNDRVESFKAGCDLNMPGGSRYMEKATMKALKNGRLEKKYLDRSVERILKVVEKSGKREKRPFSWLDHHKLAVSIAEEGAVLLKNEESLLPLKEEKSVLLLGHMARDMRFQGTGSSHINSKIVSQPIDCFTNFSYIECCDENGKLYEDKMESVRNEAASYDAVVVFMGLPEIMESEAFDRKDMKLPRGHVRMLEEAYKVNRNIVVVLFAGSPVECEWEYMAKAILYVALPGEGGGEAIANLIYGKVNPSGKLSETWPMKYEDVPSSSVFGKVNAEYREGIYVGYRYYDKAGLPVRYPFGYGLSYTSFTYSDLLIDGRKVSFIVRNSGERKGKEVVELYVRNPEGGYRSVRELRDFAKIELEKGEEKRVSFVLSDRDFSIYQNGWKTVGGTYTIEIGSSSRDIRLSGEMVVEGETVEYGVGEDSWYLCPKGKPGRKEFEALLGRKVTDYVPHRKGTFTLDDSPMEMKDYSLLVKLQYLITLNIIAKPYGGKKDMDDPGFRMMVMCSLDCPMRSSVINAGGSLSDNAASAFVEFANGRFFRGIGKLLGL